MDFKVGDYVNPMGVGRVVHIRTRPGMVTVSVTGFYRKTEERLGFEPDNLKPASALDIIKAKK